MRLERKDVALSETFDALPGLEVRVKSVVTDGSLETMPLVWIAGEPKSEIEAALTEDSSVDQFSCLLEEIETRELLYRIEYAAGVSNMCAAIFSSEGTILDVKCSANNWTFQLLFPERSFLSETVTELKDQGIQVDVKRMVEVGRNADLKATAALTETQEEAINAAYEHGYYDIPRLISLEDLAAELGISHQALSKRLRRTNKVLAGEQIGEPGTEELLY